MTGGDRAGTRAQSLLFGLPLVLLSAVFLIIAMQAQAADPPPIYEGPASFEIDEGSTLPIGWDPGSPWCVAPNGSVADVAGEGPHVRIEGNVSNGTLTLAATTPNYFGETLLNLTCTDGSGTVALMGVPVHVLPVNDPPAVQQISLWSDLYDLANITVPNSKRDFEVFHNLNISVVAHDPDMTPADDDPSAGFDPNETLRCSLDWSFVGSLGIPQGNHTHPSLDPDSCRGNLNPVWDDLGVFSLNVTVEDRSGANESFRFQIQIGTVGECSDPIRITYPVDGFRITSETDLNPSAIMGCAEQDTYAWFVTVGNATPLEFSGPSPHIHLQNPERSEIIVVITCRATDNWYPQHPIVLERTVTGSMQGNPSAGSGSLLDWPGGVILAAVLAALAGVGLILRRRLTSRFKPRR